MLTCHYNVWSLEPANQSLLYSLIHSSSLTRIKPHFGVHLTALPKNKQQFCGLTLISPHSYSQGSWILTARMDYVAYPFGF